MEIVTVQGLSPPTPLAHRLLQDRHGELTAGDLGGAKSDGQGGAEGQEVLHFGDDAFFRQSAGDWPRD